MRNSILGTVAGLLVGTMGALAYSHYMGDGTLVADLQAKLDDANADLAKLKAYHVQTARAASVSGSSSDQLDQLEAENADLRKQLDDAKNATPTVAAPSPTEPNITTMASLMMSLMRGGGGPFQQQQRLFVMQSRLKLTPDQAAKIKAAMDADQQARREMMRQQFGRMGRGGGGPGGGGPVGGGNGGPNGGGNNGGGNTAGATPAAPLPAADNLEKAVTSVLTYQQQADYQKLQADEKAAQAETAATSQVNGVMPLLQLSDTQKEAAMQALYQVQLNSPDGNGMLGSPNPMAAFGQQAQATQAVLAKVLTPDQMALYQAQAQQTSQAMAQFQGGGRQRGNRNGAAGGDPNATGGAGGAAAGATPAATTTGTPAATDSSTTNAAAATTTPAATTNADGTPATPGASTNAAPAQ